MSEKDDVLEDKTNSESAEPQVFAVSKKNGRRQFSRRNFLELAAASAAAASLTGCGGGDDQDTSRLPEETPFIAETPNKTSSTTEAVVNRARILVREGPGIEYQVMTYAYKEQALEVICKNIDGTWFEVVLEGGGGGWVPISGVNFDFDLENIPVCEGIPTPTPLKPTDTPEPTPTATATATPTDTSTPTATATAVATPVPEAVVKEASINIRKGPGVGHPIVTYADEGQILEVICRTSDGTWFEVVLEGRERGWVSASVVSFEFDLEEIPVCEVIPTPAPAGPTDTPVPPTPLPEPTQAPLPTELPPGVPDGEVPAGEEGIKYTVEGRSYTLPCGSPIPAGAVCTCNCVAGPTPPETFTIHYWYPN